MKSRKCVASYDWKTKTILLTFYYEGEEDCFENVELIRIDMDGAAQLHTDLKEAGVFTWTDQHALKFDHNS